MGVRSGPSPATVEITKRSDQFLYPVVLAIVCCVTRLLIGQTI